MKDGLYDDKLVLGGVEFTGFDFSGGIEPVRDLTFTVTNVPSTYQIPNYDPSNKFLLILSNTTNTTYSYLIGLPLPSNYYSISNDGLVNINTIVGTYYIHEFKASNFDNLGVV